MQANELLRRLPKMDRLLEEPCLASLPRAAVVREARELLEQLRGELRAEQRTHCPTQGEAALEIARRVQGERPHLRRVLNATGVVLHTNLGRAPMAPQAAQAAAEAGGGYSNLEYDLEQGERGSRHSHVEGLLRELTGCEDALVVNNNAAAVLLMLAALAPGREVLVSRGELVEIGGSFRVPEVMEQSGAVLREVGATNKTHLRDYERAVTPETGAILKVHTSNYRIVGFTQEVGVGQLAAIAREAGLPLLCDLGSGLLRPLPGGLLGEEPTVSGWLAAGADLVTFSGDKLLGGPQAGILVGKREWIAPLKKHPLARALRIDKLTLAALEATLRLYREQREGEIPAVGMLTADREELHRRAQRLGVAIESACPAGVRWEILPCEGQVGGGSAPGELLPGWCVAITDVGGSLPRLEELLRQAPLPLVGRMHRGRLLLDVRTLTEEELPLAARTLGWAAGELAGGA